LLYLLDTNIASYIIKSRSPQIGRRLSAMPPSQVAVSSVTRAELLYGLERLPGSHPLHGTVMQFLAIIRILAWESAAADWYADIRHQVVTAGQPIGEMDMMIAAHAVAMEATLITNNTRHYERIQAPLRLENWTDECGSPRTVANPPASLTNPLRNVENRTHNIPNGTMTGTRPGHAVLPSPVNRENRRWR
jgi:tRNA(fMet)-specific endonuclease VapC